MNFSSESGQSSIVSGIIGGAIVAAVFTVLILAGVLKGETEQVVQSAPGAATSSVSDGGKIKTVNQIYKESAPGVVSVRTRVSSGSNSPFGGSSQGTASGSGAVIDKRGYIVTNAHVVANTIGNPQVQFNDENTVSAKVVGTDPSNDIAVLKVDIDKKKLHPLPLGDSSKVEVGNPVVAIGNPFGLDRTVTTGIVSALQREITAPNNFTINNVIQTDAAINPGNSGGPLFDAQGRIIGINSQIATAGGVEGNVGIGFAVAINTIKRVIPELEKKGKVDYAYLGVTTLAMTAEIAGKLNYGDRKTGALVACVVKAGPADKAGLAAGSDTATISGQSVPIGADLITKIGGKEIKSNEDVQGAVLAHKPGEKIDIEVVRGGKGKKLSTKLGTRPADDEPNNCTRSTLSP